MVNVAALAWMFGAGLLAAAPVGPVNTVAIRRGLLWGPARTLWVGLGSVLVEAGYVAAAIWGAEELAQRIPQRAIQHWLGVPGAGVIFLLGVVILRKAFGRTRRLMASLRVERMRSASGTPARDLLAGAILTLINPLTLLYWLVVIGSKWLEIAHPGAGAGGRWLGLAAGVAGLTGWFAFLTLLVLLRPQKVGPRFLRGVNLLCGLALAGLGIVLGIRAAM